MMNQPPTNAKIEVAAAFLKGAVSAIPFVGGVAAELANLYINPLEKRKQQWMAEVSHAIEDIREKYGLIPEVLQNDDRFVSFLYQTTFLALKTHQRQKIKALRNAIVSAAKPGQVSEDLAFQFLRYIDELSVTHLSMLACLDKHAGQFARLEKLEQVYSKLQSYLDASIERAVFRSFLHDLQTRFLIQVGDLEDLPEYASKEIFLATDDSTTQPMEVTRIGRSFLSFVDREKP